MTEKRLLAILAMILGLIAGVLVLLDVFSVRGNQTIDLEFLVGRGIRLVVALALLFGSVLLYRGQGTTGGLINLVGGILALVLAYGLEEAALGILSGILGLLCGRTSP